MKPIPLYIALIGLATVFGSCKKKTDIESLAPIELLIPETKEDLSTFLKNAARKAEVFKINAQMGGKFSTSKGNIYTIAPNIFAKTDGSTVIGTVEISVKEITEASEMILEDKPTNAELPSKDTINPVPAILESFGEFKVEAKQGTEELELKPNTEIQVEIPKPVEEPVLQGYQVPLWTGDTTYRKNRIGYDHENREVFQEVAEPVSAGMTWKYTNASTSKGEEVVEEVSVPTLSFGIPKLGEWRNCDVLVQFPRSTTVLGFFTNVFNDTAFTDSYAGTQANMLFFKKKGDKVLAKLYNHILNAPEGKKGLLSYQNSFGIGMEGTFIALVSKDGKYYTQKKAVTIGEPENGKNYVGISFTLSEVTKEQMLSLIESMDNE